MRGGIYILPSMLTLGNLLSGFYAIVSVFNGDYVPAAVAILIAGIFDALDGAVARLTGATTDFGIQLDSLADLVSFGIAPGVLAYSWALQPFQRIGWLACFLFVSCGALRLARFNVQARTGDKRYFVGLPIPAAAGFVASFVLFMKDSSSVVLFRHEVLSPPVTSAMVAICIYLLSFLMVSRIKYLGLKGIDFKRQRPFALLVVLILCILLIASQPALLIFGFFFCYVLSGMIRYVPFPGKHLIKEKREKISEGL
ncbi:MAG: CDP-diacylglycerol--serine O-phosphatidyltransferase [candidate division NC10 bacterium]|nr:CDP-diacylglycerol--serine O-phosphatidyltransferase [candidate division NC10 bacterium]